VLKCHRSLSCDIFCSLLRSLSLSFFKYISCDFGDLSTSRTDGSERCDVLEVRRGTNPLSGTFRVGLDSTDHLIMSKRGAFISGPIAHNAFASAADTNGDGTSMEEILEAMPNVGDVEVSRVPVNLGGNSGGYSWLVTFLRDADSPCEEKDESTGLCNSPGTIHTFASACNQTSFDFFFEKLASYSCSHSPSFC